MSGRRRHASLRAPAIITVFLVLTISLSTHARAASADDLSFIITTLSTLFHGALVFWMAAGFGMLESGLVQTKSVSTILLKNITIVAIAAVAYALVGYALMFEGASGDLFYRSLQRTFTSPDAGKSINANVAFGAHWFFQMVFVATAASIVSGTVAERIKLWPFFAFVFALTAFIYPVAGGWHWGGGWLSNIGFVDFAGATMVHSVGGWAALTGAVVLGARRGKYGEGGKVQRMNASALPLATLGTFILWLGWYGFNGGSIAELRTPSDAIRLANIYLNTTMGAAGGILAAIVLLQVLKGKIDVRLALNGALAGLVSITASPDTLTPGLAILVGAVGGILTVITTPLLDRFRIDDVVGAIPVHLVSGMWGTMAVCLTHPDANPLVQLAGILSVGAFTGAASLCVWLLVRKAMGLRLSKGEEVLGGDRVELGTPAYPEFRLNS